MNKTETTYEFRAFPATYWAKDKGTKYNPHGYRFGCLSQFSFDSLKAARCEVRRLKKVYKLCKRDDMDRCMEKKVTRNLPYR